MMVLSKKITVKKTKSGNYNIQVVVNDGDVANDLKVGIQRFFDKITEENHD